MSCMTNENKRQYVNVLFDKGLLEKIDDFRFKHRMPSRTEAVRWLIQAALDKKLIPEKN